MKSLLFYGDMKRVSCYHGVDYFMLPLVSKSYPSQRYISTTHKLQPTAGVGAKLLLKLKALSQMLPSENFKKATKYYDCFSVCSNFTILVYINSCKIFAIDITEPKQFSI